MLKKRKNGVNKMKKELLNYLEERMKELAAMKYDQKTTERYRTMASGAWAELKLVYSFVKRMGW